MSLLRYFDTDDGSLPEILVAFADPTQVTRAFAHLFSCGARDVSVGGARLWLTASQSEHPFRADEDQTQLTGIQAEILSVGFYFMHLRDSSARA